MKKDKKYYNEFFTKYPVNVHDNADRFLAVSSLLVGKVLDMACGTGTLSDYYNGSYVGIDISDVAIAKAKEVRRKSAVFFTADLENVKLKTQEKFHSVYIGEFLEHIENDEKVFKSAIDLLEMDGIIVVTVPNGDRVPDESHCRTFTVPQIRRDYSKYGKILFHNWSGAKDRILFTVEPFKIPRYLVSLVMIVKNEEKGVETAILSALPLVDNIVVSVDEATTDDTENIVKLYADVLKRHKWDNDFSKVRNKTQTGVKTKWTLFLDGHEYIEKTDRIDNLLLLDVDGILTTIKMENGATFMYPRIFRSYLKFENAVHNAIDCKKIQYAPKFIIVHDRHNLQSIESSKEREKQRDRMIPQIMKERLKEEPKDQRALFNLANWYMTKNELKLAIKIYKRCYKETPSPDERYFVQAQIGIAQQLLGQNLRATWSFFDLERLIPDRWETKRLLGGVYLQRGQYKKAVEYLVHALGPNKKQYMYQLFGQDLSEIWDLVAHCFNLLDQNPQAVIAWEQAAKESKDEKRSEFFLTKARFAKMLCPGGEATRQ